MLHFDNEYKELLQLRGPSMVNSTLHSANSILQEVTNQVDASVDAAIQRHVINSTITGQARRMAIPDLNNSIPADLQNLPPGYSIQEIPPSTYPFDEHQPATANRMTSTLPTNMEQFMKMFMDRMDSRFKAQEDALKDITNKGIGGGGKRRAGGAYCRRTNISRYCWTHGACAHDSKNCRNKADGHRNNATFQNKLGGSTRFCNPQE